MFSHDQLISFCAVYEKGSFSAGARLLNKDRSTTREHIVAMEDSIGVNLFTVEGRSARPTGTAHKLYPRACVIVKQLKEFSLEALSSFEHEISVLNIAFDAMIPTDLITSVELEMAKSWPSVRLNWLQRNRQSALEGLLNEEVHLALMPIKNKVNTEKEVVFANLGIVRSAIFTKADHPLQEKASVTLADLQLEKQYIIEDHYIANLQASVISPHYHLVGNTDVLVSLLKEQGWALLPIQTADLYERTGYIKKLEVAELVNTVNYNICTFHSPAMEQHPLLMTLVATIKNYAATHLK